MHGFKGTLQREKKVKFDPDGDRFIPPCIHQSAKTKEQMKASWYSREDLMDSCAEAKKIVKMIHSVDGNMDAIDHTQVCVVGLEKFHGKKDRDKHRKLLIRSVLIRQEMNRNLGVRHEANATCLSEISQLISSSFKEWALWQASMHAFHAHGKVPKTSESENPLQSQDLGSVKRQKLNTGNYSPSSNAGDSSISTSTSETLSSNLVRNPESIRDEMHQLVAGYCSR